MLDGENAVMRGTKSSQDRELVLFIVGWLGLVVALLVVGLTVDAWATAKANAATPTPKPAAPASTPTGGLPVYEG